jgi:hypothetical protein
VVCFLYNFHVTKENVLSLSNLEKITDHTVRLRIGTDKNTSDTPNAPVGGRGLIIYKFNIIQLRKINIWKY